MATFNYNQLIAEAQASGAQTSYEPVPEGEYECTVKEAKAQQSKKGDPQLVVVFKVGADGEYKNRQFWHRMTFVPGNGVGIAINLRQLDALGATPLMEQGGSLEQVAAFLTGKSALVKVGFGQGAFSDKNEVKDVKKLPLVTHASRTPF